MRTITGNRQREATNDVGSAQGAAAGRAMRRGCLLFAISLTLAACAQKGGEPEMGGDTIAAENPTAEEAVRQGGAPVDEVRSAANQMPGEGPVVMVSDTRPLHLVDASGNALYALEGNQDGSKCDMTCESAWPPVVAHSSQPTTAPGLQPGMLGTLPREGGGMQVTYDGNPLYRYAGDMGAASTAGQGVSDKWGNWRLMGSDGGFVEQAVEDTPATGAPQAPSGTGETVTPPVTDNKPEGNQP